MRLATLGPHYTRAALHPGCTTPGPTTRGPSPCYTLLPPLLALQAPGTTTGYKGVYMFKVADGSTWYRAALYKDGRHMHMHMPCTCTPNPYPSPSRSPSLSPPHPSHCAGTATSLPSPHCAGIATSARGPTALQTPSRRRCERRACPAHHLHRHAQTRCARAPQHTPALSQKASCAISPPKTSISPLPPLFHPDDGRSATPRR